jgi:uncharacterized protein YqeY
MIRDDIKAALVEAMKARDERRVGALRMMQAAIKNKDIELRTAPTTLGDDQVVAEVLTKMAKQRRESIEMYVAGNRPELADAERAELAVVESFLPQQMDPAQAQAAVRALVEELGAEGPKDMGRVMAALKDRFAGQIDMSRASLMVKQALNP